jgi:hypothetical protein
LFDKGLRDSRGELGEIYLPLPVNKQSRNRVVPIKSEKVRKESFIPQQLNLTELSS